MRFATLACWVVLFGCSDASDAGSSASASGGRGGKRSASAEVEAPVADTPAPKAKPGAPPNIVFVLVDDQRAISTDCMSELHALIGAKGTEFKNAFATTPLCCPSRATSLTGLYAQHHGVLANGDVEGEDEESTPGLLDFNKHGNEERVIAKVLQKAGYRTGFVGKYLNGYDKLLEDKKNYVPPYWDDWYAFPHAEFFDFMLVERSKGGAVKTVCYPSSDGDGKKKDRKQCRKGSDEVAPKAESYSTDVLTEKAIAFIDAAAREAKPFFLYLAPKAPHGPMLSPKRYQPDPDKAEFTSEAKKRLRGCSLFDWKDRPPSFREADVSDKPRWVQELTPASVEKLDEIRQQQLVSMLAVEDGLEKIVAKLKSLGVDGNTVIIYMGDNGYAWGEHGYKAKNCAYEECLHVPLFVYDPRFPKTKQVDASFVLNADIPPTLAEIAGVDFAHDRPLDGKSLVPLWNGKGGFERDEVPFECWGTGKRAHPSTVAGVRTKRWKYIEHYGDPQRTKPDESKKGAPVVELYDLDKDPYELDNLLGIPAEKLKATGHDKAELDGVVKDHKGRLERFIRSK